MYENFVNAFGKVNEIEIEFNICPKVFCVILFFSLFVSSPEKKIQFHPLPWL